jgi:DNA-binding HxlR family transcriptional regulator
MVTATTSTLPAVPTRSTTGVAPRTLGESARDATRRTRADSAVEEVCREGLCPKYQKAMSLLGKRWTGLVLRVLLDGPARFGDFLARIDGISDPILCERLKELNCEGLVERRVLPEIPVRVEYALTSKGEGLRSILLMLHKWADEWGDVSGECDEC